MEELKFQKRQEKCFSKFTDLFERKQGLPEKEDRTKLTHALEELANHIQAAVNTNIKMHFFSRQLKYLRSCFSLKKKEAVQRQKELNESRQGSEDELLTLPRVIERSVAWDLKVHPEKFLFPMWQMNQYFVMKGVHTFAVLPISKGFTPSASLSVDTFTLEGFINKKYPRAEEYFSAQKRRREEHRKKMEMEDKKKREQNTQQEEEIVPTKKKRKRGKKPGRDEDDISLAEKDLLWDSFFNIQHVLTKSQIAKKEVRFGHRFTTDGISVSISLLHIGKKEEKRKKKQKTSTRTSYPTADRTSLSAAKVVGVDPGKCSIVHMTTATSPRTSKEKTLEYTARQRRFESHSRERSDQLQKMKSISIQNLESELAQQNSRASSLEEFKSYLSTRFKVQQELYKHYSNMKYRIYRWWNWRDRRRSEDRFINRIGKVFGKDCILAYGTWSSFKNVKGAPVPTVSLRRRIAKKYRVIGMSLISSFSLPFEKKPSHAIVVQTLLSTRQPRHAQGAMAKSREMKPEQGH